MIYVFVIKGGIKFFYYFDQFFNLEQIFLSLLTINYYY